jgi:hypothetical protein
LSAHAARARPSLGERPAGELLSSLAARYGITVAVALVIVLTCFYATGGLDLGPATTVQMIATLAGGGLVIACVAQEGAGRSRLWGAGSTGVFLLLAAFTALSVSWSVEPANSWAEASRTFSYAATFAGGVALVRLAAGRWRDVIAGVLLGIVVVTAYAVGTKVFAAGATGYEPVSARLNAPFDYWNVVGALAAMGVPLALWVGSRRDGHGALVALAPPAICLLLVTVMLSYSRGSLIALVVGLAFWFSVVPLRLRSASILAIGAAGAAIVVAWTFSETVLTTDNEPLAARASAGHELGLLLLSVLIVSAAAGLATRFATLRNPPSAAARQRAGKALVVCLCLIPVAGVIGLAASPRGLFGSISHDVSTLTNTNAGVSNTADRLTALGSQRALYWSDAIKAFDANPLAGNGAGSFQTTFLRYDKSQYTTVAQAHSYIFQTLADLGLLGLGISLALAGAWIAAAIRAAEPFRRRAGPAGESAERVGLLAMITTVVIFAAHSTVDWTWFVPGLAMIAIFLAGWVAGRGPSDSAPDLRPPRRQSLREPLAALVAATVAALALLLTWSEWQPLRSQDATNAAFSALVAGGAAPSKAAAQADFRLAAADARTAMSEDPVDYQPLVWLAYAQSDLRPHYLRIAYATMVSAVKLQPANYETWLDLGEFDYNRLLAVKPALSALARSLYLYPKDSRASTYYVEWLPGASSTPAAPAAKKKH